LFTTTNDEGQIPPRAESPLIRCSFLFSLAFPLLLVCSDALAEQNTPKQKADPALQRTRRTVRMLDDIYKGGIVAITANYVNDKDTVPAGTAFKQVFKSAAEKGWHEVRLVDGLDDPLNDENSPRDAFEKQALKALVAGTSTWFEQEEVEQGQRVLRVATPIPVVFEKCIMCHDNYEDVPAGQAIGALTYKIKIE
jgi:hypothetical protein